MSEYSVRYRIAGLPEGAGPREAVGCDGVPQLGKESKDHPGYFVTGAWAESGEREGEWFVTVTFADDGASPSVVVGGEG